MQRVFVTGGFDDLRSSHIRFLETASKLGEVQVWLWPDESVRALTGNPPKFPAEERLYLVQAIRYVSLAAIAPAGVGPHGLPNVEGPLPAMWAVEAEADDAQKRAYCEAHGLDYRVLRADEPKGVSDVELENPVGSTQRKKVIVTGC